MKFCPNCGNALNGQSKFCPECGFKVEAAPMPAAPPTPVFEAPAAPPPAPPVQEAPVAPPPPAPPVQEAPVAPPPPPAPPVQEAPVAPPPPPAPPVQTYAPPVQEAPVAPPPPPAPPAQTYAPPVQEAPVAPPPPPAPPVQTYAPPVQKAPVAPPPPPAPPVQTYAPPAQKAPVAPPPPPASPVQPYVPSASPSAPKAGKKSRLPLFIGIGAAVVLIILAIIFVPKLFGGDANLGKYECVSMNMMGFEITGSELEEMGESWIELKSDGKCTVMLMDDKINGTWELDGTKITCELDGETCKGKLKDGKLELTVEAEGMELELVFEKKGSDKGGKGSEKETEAAPTPVGKYEGTSISVMGTELTGDMLAAAGETWLELKEDGSVTLMIMDDEVRGTYTLDGKDISCDLEGITASGDWDGTQVNLSVDQDGVEMIMKFTKGGGSTQPGGSTVSGYDWWEGDWYGWWIVSDGDGEYEELIDYYWDACATITVDGDTGNIAIWDEDGSKNDLLADVEIEFGEGFGDYGNFVSKSGTFMDCEIGYYDWLVDSDGDDASDIKDMICISGSSTNSDGDSFDYYVFLRPWGTEWDDVDGEKFPNAPYEDMMPAYYHDWYLPLIEDGETEAPDSF